MHACPDSADSALRAGNANLWLLFRQLFELAGHATLMHNEHVHGMRRCLRQGVTALLGLVNGDGLVLGHGRRDDVEDGIELT